jgi:hypothetical protein
VKAAVLSALFEESPSEGTVARKRREKWVHRMWERRKSAGEFCAFFCDLMDDDRKLKKYCGMSYELHSIVKRNETEYCASSRESVGPNDRLAVCLG